VNRLPVILERMELNRQQTLRFIHYLKLVARQEAAERGTAAETETARLLAADPSGGGPRALGSIGWHLLHIAIHEEGCCGAPRRPELWRRFAHGNPPFVVDRSLAEIEADLAEARAHLLALAADWDEATLDAVPQDTPGEMTYRDLLESAAWHEPHHLAMCNENLHGQFIEG
jgi:hypothetical protein